MNEMKKISKDEYLKLMNEIKKREKERMKKVKEIEYSKSEVKDVKIKKKYKKYVNSTIKMSKYSNEAKEIMRKIQENNRLEKIKRKKTIITILDNENNINYENKIVINSLMNRIINLLKYDDLVRRDIVDIIGVARTTIYDNLVKLKKLKLVFKYQKYNGVGRPLIFWSLDKNKLKEVDKIDN